MVHALRTMRLVTETFPTEHTMAQKNTIKFCKKACFKKGYKYAGLQYSKECFCGNNVPRKVASQQSECNMGCSGDRSQKCGGPNRMNVYLSAGIILKILFKIFTLC